MNAIIIAAGMGTRLRPLTLSTPKPLIKIFGKPMIERNIEFLLEKGLKEIIVVTGYLGEQFSYLEGKYLEVKLVHNDKFNEYNNIYSFFKDGSGFFDDIQLPISEAVINFILSIVLVQYIGLNGVIIGTIASNILIICIAKPILVFKRCFDKNIKDYIKIYGIYLVLIILSLLSCNFILNFIPLKNINTWFDWIINGVIVGSITFIIVFIIFLSNRDFRNNLLLLRRK